MFDERVKVVRGESYLLVEDVRDLKEEELLSLIHTLADQSEYYKLVKLLLHQPLSQKVAGVLLDRSFVLEDTFQYYRRALTTDLDQVEDHFQLRSIGEINVEVFKQVWEKTMEGSLNASSNLNMDEQMKGVAVELGNGYERSCMVAFEDGEAIGVLMPHIEPGTEQEGRFFYFGLVPEARGQGKASSLYLQGLKVLRREFGAGYCIGGTSSRNLSMHKVFEKTGFVRTDVVDVFKLG